MPCYALGYELPKRQYRVPEEICSDIRRVIGRLKEINETLNIRNLLAEVISSQSEGDAKKRITALNELFEYATEALSEMSELEENLDALKKELYEVMA